MAWNSTTGVFDFVRSPEAGGAKVAFFSVEILDSSGRVFTTTDLDNRTVAAVMDTGTAGGMVVDKGTEDDPIAGYVEDISQDGAVASLLIMGLTDDVNYSETAAEDPDVGDNVVTDGDGEVKQTPTDTDIQVGGRTNGRGHVVYKDTTNKMVRIWHP